METLNLQRTEIIKKDLKGFEIAIKEATSELIKFIIEELKNERRLPFNVKSKYGVNICPGQKIMIAIRIFNEKLNGIIQNTSNNNNNEEFRKIS